MARHTRAMLASLATPSMTASSPGRDTDERLPEAELRERKQQTVGQDIQSSSVVGL